jgi:hypothetical protein
MVEREDLMNAIALNSSMFNGARVVGPAVAGLLVAAIGEGWCFFANGASYIAVIIGLMMMRIPNTHEGHALSGTAIENIVEGFRYVARTAPIRALLLLIGVISFCGMPFAVLTPVFAENILHSGARGLRRWVAMSAGAFGAALALFALSRSMILSTILLVPVGAMLIQSMVPDALRGRVMSVYSMMFMGMGSSSASACRIFAVRRAS